MKPIYLDYAATTPVRSEVLEAMLPYFSETFGNASSLHIFGQKARKALEDARDIVAECIRAKPEEIYFTSGGTESDNLAIKGMAYAHKNKGKHLVTSMIEHQAVLNCCKYLEKEGFEVSYLPVDRCGIVDLQALEDATRLDTILLSVMLGNNETGTLQPIAEMARIARKRGVPLHTDAVQAIGKIPVAVDELGVDLLSISSHKIYGPKGVGALYVRRGTRIDPLLHGGHHERQMRAGTENIPGIVGFSKAIECAQKEMLNTSAHVTALRDRLEQRIGERIEHIQINGHPTKRLPHILNVSFDGIEAEQLLLALDMRGIAISTGAACISGAPEPSHVLRAMGADLTAAQGSVRFSLGRDNTEAEMDFVIESLTELIQQLRQREPL
ncbi:MAG: cysteine desulfurase NifS [Pseudomonadota bacterium]